MNNFLKSLDERWNNLSKPKKSIIIVLSIAVILSAAFFVQWMTKVEYAPLMTDLNPAEANAIVEKLKEFGVNYKLENQGTTILVPQAQVYEIMIELAGAGVLQNNEIGFEIFDQQRLGATDFDNNVNFMRALQGELQRTIMAFSEIEEARVHLVMPQDSLFIEDEKPASAAITLEIKPLAQLRPEQVKGIIDLVSSSVPNLPPENVKIIDTTGRVLSDEINLDEGHTLIRQTQYELRREFEKDLEKRVHNLLATIFGEGRAVVMISADLDFDQVEEEVIDYGEGSVVGEETLTEESTGTVTGGVVGDPNLTPQVPGYEAANQTESTYNQESNTTNYLVDQIKRVTVRAPGQIRSLSASVVVDGQLTEEQLAEMEQVVAAAIGFQQLRGDQISVTSMTFDMGPEDLEIEPEITPPESPYPSYLPYLAAGLAGLIGILFFVGIRRRRRREEALEEPVIEEVVPTIPVEPVAPKLSPEEQAKKDKHERVKEAARKKPDEVAQLIKAWLAED